MSHNQSDTSQSETLTLVTVEDLTPTCQGCSHQDGAHGPGGCRYATWEGGPCSCKEPASRVLQKHWTRVVRREIASESDQILQEHVQDLMDREETLYGGKLATWDVLAEVLTILEDRSKEIRNG